MLRYQDCSVGILTNNAINAGRDKKALYRMNFKRISVFGAFSDIVPFVEDRTVNMLIVDSHATDIDGCACIKKLRREVEQNTLPAVMVASDSSHEFVLSAISAGCSGFVIRPYSLDTFEKHIQLAWKSSQRDEIEFEQIRGARNLIDQGFFDDAIDELEEVVAEENEADRYFNMGMDYLHRQFFGKAILAFNKAVKQNAMFAEAYKGLADAHKGKGDDAKYLEFMKKSAEVLAIQDRLDELRDLFVDILKADPEAVNPYNSMGLTLRRDGDFPGALHAYSQALKLTPKDDHLHFNVAKAYIFADDYEKAIHHLEEAVRLNEDFFEARDLLNKTAARAVDFGTLNEDGRSPWKTRREK